MDRVYCWKDIQLMNKYQLIEEIGRGNYSVVYRAVRLATREGVAVKHIPGNNHKIKGRINNQISILNRFKKHPNIITLQEVLTNNKQQYFLIFELSSQTLIQLYKSYQLFYQKPLPQHQIKSILFQIAVALDTLHSNRIMHRDIKPQNILVSGNLIKLIDFGIAKKNDFGKNTEYVSTRWYRSPEVLLGLPYSFSSDIFGLGCLTLELYHSEEVFRGASTIDQIGKICEFVTDLDDWQAGVQRIIKMGLQIFRLGSRRAQILSLIPSEQGRKLVVEMLAFNPYKRIRAHDILRHPYFTDVVIPKQVSAWLSSIRSQKISVGWPAEKRMTEGDLMPGRSSSGNKGQQALQSGYKNTKRTLSSSNFPSSTQLTANSQQKIPKTYSSPYLEQPYPCEVTQGKPKKISLREKRCVYGVV